MSICAYLDVIMVAKLRLNNVRKFWTICPLKYLSFSEWAPKEVMRGQPLLYEKLTKALPKGILPCIRGASERGPPLFGG